MADGKYYLNEALLKEIRAMIAAEHRRVAGTINRPDVPDELPGAPEVYLAWVPPSGIPPISEVGTGTGLTGTGTGTTDGNVNEPGSATCTIFRGVQIEGSKQIKLVPHLTRTVYNHGRERIIGSQYVLAIRDKFGSWWTQGATTDDAVADECPGTGIDGFEEADTGTGTAPDPLNVVGLGQDGCWYIIGTTECVGPDVTLIAGGTW